MLIVIIEKQIMTADHQNIGDHWYQYDVHHNVLTVY